MVKARLENNQVAVYDDNCPKPFTVIEGYENGFKPGISFWGGDQLSEDEWKSFGFYNYEPPVYDNRIQYISNINFNAETEIFEAVVSDIEWNITLEEFKQNLLKSLKRKYNYLLSETDWVIVRNTELNQSTDQSILDSRAALRAECTTKENEILALQSHNEVALYEI